jgi:hypothetical protein
VSDTAMLFMGLAWTFVLGLTGWCYYRLIRAPRSRG